MNEKGKEVINIEEHKAKILISGVFEPGDIKVTMSGHRLSLPHNLAQKVESEWASKAAKGWFPGPLIKVDSYNLTPDGQLSLTFGNTDYKEFLGTSDKQSRKKYGLDNIANPLVTSTAIVTADNKMLISQRGAGTHQAGNIDAIGGHINPQKDLKEDETVDLYKAAEREVAEEAKLELNEMDEIHCLGLIYNYADTSHFAAPFVIKTYLSSNEILKRGAEEIDLIVVDPERIPDSDSEDYVLNVLHSNFPKVDPEARITIALTRRWLSHKPLEKRLYRSRDQITT